MINRILYNPEQAKDRKIICLMCYGAFLVMSGFRFYDGLERYLSHKGARHE